MSSSYTEALSAGAVTYSTIEDVYFKPNMLVGRYFRDSERLLFTLMWGQSVDPTAVPEGHFPPPNLGYPAVEKIEWGQMVRLLG